jgi:hypothetical protein
MKCFFLPNGPWVSRDSTAAPHPVATARIWPILIALRPVASGVARKRKAARSPRLIGDLRRAAIFRSLAGSPTRPPRSRPRRSRWSTAPRPGLTCRSRAPRSRSRARSGSPSSRRCPGRPTRARPAPGPGLRRHRLPDRIDAPAHDGQQPVQPRQDVYLAGRNRLPAEFLATGGGGRLSLDREPLFP